MAGFQMSTEVELRIVGVLGWSLPDMWGYRTSFRKEVCLPHGGTVPVWYPTALITDHCGCAIWR
jgi:hypothetical protein